MRRSNLPLSRYLKVRGKPGLACANPYALANNPPRYAGKRRDAALDGEPEHLERYRDCEEIFLSHPDLLKAIAQGDLVELGRCSAMSRDEAEKLMAAPKKKGSE